MKLDRRYFKTCLLGEGGVGKTTLVHRYTTGSFLDETLMTIGVSIHVKPMEVDDLKFSLQVWDFGGEDRFRILAPDYFNGAVGAILMYDITRYSTFKNLSDWLEVLELDSEKMKNEIPILLVGCKLDLDEKRKVKKSEAREMARKLNFYDFFECSSKTGENVNEIFESLAHVMLKKGRLR